MVGWSDGRMSDGRVVREGRRSRVTQLVDHRSHVAGVRSRVAGRGSHAHTNMEQATHNDILPSRVRHCSVGSKNDFLKSGAYISMRVPGLKQWYDLFELMEHGFASFQQRNKETKKQRDKETKNKETKKQRNKETKNKTYMYKQTHNITRPLFFD